MLTARIALVGLAVFMSLPSAVAYSPMYPPNELAYKGYLTWKQGVGGISWDTNSASEDNVEGRSIGDFGDPTLNSDYQYVSNAVDSYSKYLGASPRQVTGNDPRQAADDVYISERLPVDVRLNATRGIDVWFYLKDAPQNRQGTRTFCHTPSTAWNVDLFANDHIMGAGRTEAAVGGLYGTDRPTNDYWDNEAESYPTAPSGYCLMLYRLAPEVDLLAAGSILKLRVERFEDQGEVAVGLQGDHRSIIRFNVFSDEEEVFRFGRLTGTPSSDAAQGARPESVGVAAFWLAPMLRRSRRMEAVVLGLILVAASGCVTPDVGDEAADVQSPGTVRQSIVDGNVTQALDDVGTIVGTVQDQAGDPVADASVSLVRTGWKTTTSLGGRFTFREIPSGTHNLKVEKPGYKTLLAPIVVKAGAFTTADVVIEALESAESGKVRHRHDYWAGAKSDKIVTDLDVGRMTSYSTPIRFVLPRTPNFEDNFVRPGSVEVEVSVSWDESVSANEKLPGLMLAFRHRGDLGPYNFSIIADRGSGEPFHIRTTWEMTDQGHSRGSDWVFVLVAPGHRANAMQRQDVPLGPFFVDVTLHQGGNLPLESPHPPELEAGHNTILVSDDQTMYTANSWPAATRVSTDAKWLEVVLKQSARADLTGTDFALTYYPHTTIAGPGYCAGDAGTAADAPVRNGLVSTWRFAIKPEETDGLYATPGWCLKTWLPDDVQSYAYLVESYGAGRYLSLNLTATVHVDPMPA